MLELLFFILGLAVGSLGVTVLIQHFIIKEFKIRNAK